MTDAAGVKESSQWKVIVGKDTEGNYIAKSVNDKNVKKEGDKYIEDTVEGSENMGMGSENDQAGGARKQKSKKNKSKGGKSKSKRGLKKSRKQRK